MHSFIVDVEIRKYKSKLAIAQILKESMCLFTNDLYSECNHVECNLIRSIQLQNTHIFPQIVSNSDIHCQNDINEAKNLNESQSVNHEQSQSENGAISQKSIFSNHFPVKQQGQLNPSMTHHQMNNHFQKIMIDEKPQLASSRFQSNQSFHCLNQTSANQSRVQMLQTQVSMLKNGMSFLLKKLKDKNILNEQEYQSQILFLQQFDTSR